jgi:hypothetical protein
MIYPQPSGVGGVPYTDEKISEILKPHFLKFAKGCYHAHLNGSDVVIRHSSTEKWTWTLAGRQSGKGYSKSLLAARTDSWRATLNPLELAAHQRGELSIP